MVLIVLGIILLLWFVRRLLQKNQDNEGQTFVSSVSGPLIPQPQTVESKKKEISAKEKEYIEQFDHIKNMAKGKPDNVAQLIKTWLAEE